MKRDGMNAFRIAPKFFHAGAIATAQIRITSVFRDPASCGQSPGRAADAPSENLGRAASSHIGDHRTLNFIQLLEIERAVHGLQSLHPSGPRHWSWLAGSIAEQIERPEQRGRVVS